MATKERAAITPKYPAAANLGRTDTVDRIVRYYTGSPGYLYGPLAGTCHFGYTPIGKPFELNVALRSMETLLGQKIALPPGSIVLDAGCGFGRVTTTLASEPFGLNVVGIDLIPERLREASRYTKAHGVSEKVQFINGNYCALPLRDSSISGIFTMETLVHADPLEAALGEFWRVLKPDGRLVLFEYSVPERATLDPLRRWITDVMVQRIGMVSIERFTHNAFSAILRDAQFENIDVMDISRNVWPTWHWMFFRAIRDLPRLLCGKITDYTNILASYLIWPYRHQLGYKVVTATKPGAQSAEHQLLEVLY